jgi:Flp pilus assembly pilin Flp
MSQLSSACRAHRSHPTARAQAPAVGPRHVIADRRGIAIVEYLIIVAVLALGVIAAVRAVGRSIGDTAGQAGERIVAMMAMSTGSSGAATAADSEPSPERGSSTVPIGQNTLNEIEKLPPAQVKDWWDGLTQTQREQVLRDHPDQVGGLDGIPSADRDAANRATLERELARSNAELAEAERQLPGIEATQRALEEHARTRQGPPTVRGGYEEQFAPKPAEQQARIDQLKARIAQLTDIKNARGPADSERFLLGYTLDEPGRDGNAIIALGNPDTARHTAVYVPGLDTVTSSIGANDLGRVERLRDAALKQEKQRGDGADQASVSTVMWLGYDAPSDGPSVITDGRSHDGAEPLRQFVNGLRATHQGDPAHLTAVGHSYGSTVVAEALRGGGLAVDDVVVAGSPGLHADHASDLTNDPRHLWVGASSRDPVASAGSYNPALRAASIVAAPIFPPIVAAPDLQNQIEGLHGPSPQNPEFGANEFKVEPGDHSSYWNENTDSLNNQANIVIGKYSAVHTEHAEVPPDVP